MWKIEGDRQEWTNNKQPHFLSRPSFPHFQKYTHLHAPLDQIWQFCGWFVFHCVLLGSEQVTRREKKTKIMSTEIAHFGYNISQITYLSFRLAVSSALFYRFASIITSYCNFAIHLAIVHIHTPIVHIIIMFVYCHFVYIIYYIFCVFCAVAASLLVCSLFSSSKWFRLISSIVEY